VQVALTILKVECTRNLEVVAICLRCQNRAETGVAYWLPKCSEECPVGEIVGWCAVEWHTWADSLDSRSKDGVVVRLRLTEKGIHRWPWLQEWISEASNVPACWRSLDDWVACVFLPSHTTIARGCETLGFGARDVVCIPRSRQVSDRSVHDGKIAITSSIKTDGLSSTGKDTQTIVATVTGRTERKSVGALPGGDIGPRDKVFACGVAPADVSPIDVLRVPLVEGVV